MSSNRVARLLPRFLITQVVVAAIWNLAHAESPSTPASAAVPVSRSIGSSEDGRLIDGAQLPARARGMKRLTVVGRRGTGYGTGRLVAFVRSVAEQLAGLPGHGGVPLRVGNLSVAGGGPISWSHSHQAGRDVDLALYALDRRGRAAAPDRFLAFNDRGRARHGRRRYRFDTARNWHLVRAVLAHPGVHIAHLYLAEPLRRLLLGHARAVGEPEWLVQRAAQLLREPLHAGRHDDHLHVRLFCSRDEVLTGCVDGGVRWPWVPDHAAARRQRIDTAIAGLGEPSAAGRHLAVGLLAPLHRDDRVATDALVWAAAFDADTAVRSLALTALSEMAGRWTFRQAMQVLPQAREATAGVPLLKVAIGAAGPDDAATLLGLLGPDGGVVSHLLSPRERSVIRRLVVRRIRPWMLESAAAPLLAVLADSDPTTRRSALRTLEHLANRRFADANHAAAWHSQQGHRGRLRWLIEGFYRRGMPVDAPPSALAPLLIAQLDGGDEVQAGNAEALLRRICGQVRVAYVPTPSRRLRAWQRWWQVHQRRYQWPWAGRLAGQAPEGEADAGRHLVHASDDEPALP